MDASEAESKVPALTRSDAWLLAALTEGSRGGHPVTLAKFVHDADWLNRAIPTFDEISFGFPRLVGHGLMTVDGLRLRATPRAIALRTSIRGGALGSVLNGVGDRVGARPYPDPEVENRSLGRLPGLEPSDLESAIQEYSRWMDRRSFPMIATLKLADVTTRPLLAAKRGLKKLRARQRS